MQSSPSFDDSNIVFCCLSLPCSLSEYCSCTIFCRLIIKPRPCCNQIVDCCVSVSMQSGTIYFSLLYGFAQTVQGRSITVRSVKCSQQLSARTVNMFHMRCDAGSLQFHLSNTDSQTPMRWLLCPAMQL